MSFCSSGLLEFFLNLGSRFDYTYVCAVLKNWKIPQKLNPRKLARYSKLHFEWVQFLKTCLQDLIQNRSVSNEFVIMIMRKNDHRVGYLSARQVNLTFDAVVTIFFFEMMYNLEIIT